MFRKFGEIRINQEFLYHVKGKGSYLLVKINETTGLDKRSNKEYKIDYNESVKTFD